MQARLQAIEISASYRPRIILPHGELTTRPTVVSTLFSYWCGSARLFECVDAAEVHYAIQVPDLPATTRGGDAYVRWCRFGVWLSVFDCPFVLLASKLQGRHRCRCAFVGFLGQHLRSLGWRASSQQRRDLGTCARSEIQSSLRFLPTQQL